MGAPALCPSYRLGTNDDNGTERADTCSEGSDPVHAAVVTWHAAFVVTRIARDRKTEDDNPCVQSTSARKTRRSNAFGRSAEAMPGLVVTSFRELRDRSSARRSGGFSGPRVYRRSVGLIPAFAKESKLPYSVLDARFEELADKASYQIRWLRWQRCIIPLASFNEPNWETGCNVWWRFTRTDGAPSGLARLWNTWVDRAMGEIHESYTSSRSTLPRIPGCAEWTNPIRSAALTSRTSVR